MTTGARKLNNELVADPESPDDFPIRPVSSDSPPAPRMDCRRPEPVSPEYPFPRMELKLESMPSSPLSTAEANRCAPSGVDAALLRPDRRPGTAASMPDCVFPLLSPRYEEIRSLTSPVKYPFTRSTMLGEITAILPPSLIVSESPEIDLY